VPITSAIGKKPYTCPIIAHGNRMVDFCILSDRLPWMLSNNQINPIASNHSHINFLTADPADKYVPISSSLSTIHYQSHERADIQYPPDLLFMDSLPCQRLDRSFFRNKLFGTIVRAVASNQ
jgi:hypothetical protein